MRGVSYVIKRIRFVFKGILFIRFVPVYFTTHDYTERNKAQKYYKDIDKDFCIFPASDGVYVLLIISCKNDLWYSYRSTASQFV